MVRFHVCGVLAGQEKLMGWYTAWRVDCEMMALSAYWDWWKTFDTALYETLLSEERGMRHELMDVPLPVCGIGWMVTARVVDNSSLALWRKKYFSGVCRWYWCYIISLSLTWTALLSAPSASLWVTPISVMWSTK